MSPSVLLSSGHGTPSPPVVREGRTSSSTRVADLLLAPYLPISRVVTIASWDVIPVGKLGDAEVVPDEIGVAVERLLAAYEIPRGGGATVGAVIVPRGGHVGSPFERSAMPRLQHALFAGVVANNQRMVALDEEENPNAGFSVATSENALLHDRLLEVLVLAVSERVGDPALRLPISERLFHRASVDAFQMLRDARETGKPLSESE
jgi:hypothetical protein